MFSERNVVSIESQGNLSAEDFDALLQFPFQDYAPDPEVKEEVIFDVDLPDIRPYVSLALNKETGSTSNKEAKESEDGATYFKALEESLSENQTLQRQNVETLNRIQIALEKNLLKQTEIRESLKADKARSGSDGKMRSTRPLTLFAAPYFRDIRGMVPPDNEDTIAKLRNHDVTAYIHPPKPWSRAEKTKLVNGVGANALDFVLKQHKAKRDYLRSKLNDQDLLDFDRKILKKNIKSIEKRILEESKRDLPTLVQEANGNIDWMTISATNLEGMRSEEDCEAMWNSCLSIFVNKKPFTKAEDAQLKELIDIYNGRNWDSITEDLGTHRTAIQCFERYQTHLNENLTNKYWKPREDEKLLELVERVKVGNFIPWNKVCSRMEKRTRHQIITRYERTLNKTMDKGPWTTFDDALLIACVHKFGSRWIKMKDIFPTRSTYSIRERYVNTLESSLKIGDWSLEEDKKLAELIKTFGFGKWSQVARELPGRTDNMCLVRMQRIKNFIKNIKENSESNYDDDSDDPSYIVNNLPENESAPSKRCYMQNLRLKDTQLAALDTLKNAVEKIVPTIDECLNLDNLDLSSISLQTLEKLKKELSRMRYSGDYDTKMPFYSKKKLRKRPENCSITKSYMTEFEEVSDKDEIKYDGDEFENELMAVEDLDKVKLSDLEKSWLEKVLESKFLEESSTLALAPLLDNDVIIYKMRSALEFNLYQDYLRKEFSLPPCNYNLVEEEDPKKFFCGDIDYNLSVCDVVRHFVQPNVSKDQIMVLAPNCTTLLGLDRILASRVRLQRTAQFVDHSLPYIRYLTGFTYQRPKCIKCNGTNCTPAMFDTVLCSMKSKLLVIEESMREAAMCETRYLQIQEENCFCDELAKSKAQVELLTKRFLSLFFWPFLLSSSPLAGEQEEIMIQQLSEKRIVTSRKKSVKRKKSYTTVKADPFFTVKRKPKIKNSPPQPVRRSKRHCVLNRKSFAGADADDEVTESDGDDEM